MPAFVDLFYDVENRITFTVDVSVEKTMGATGGTKKAIGSSVSAYEKFGGADTSAPVLSNIHANTIGRSVATLDFDTDENATGNVYYGTQSTVESNWVSGTLDGTFQTSNRDIAISGLTQGTQYFYRSYATDISGNVGSSVIYKFTTGVGTTPPVEPVPA